MIAGDMTARDRSVDWVRFYEWLKALPYDKKVYTAGNHDNFLVHTLSNEEHAQILGTSEEPLYFEYLKDSGVEYKGLKIWGTPWTTIFEEINPHCKAFMVSERELGEKFKLIPEDTDILISHGPPFGIFDRTTDGLLVGSGSLSQRLMELNVGLHVFGHIHEGYGCSYDGCYHTDDGKFVGLGRVSVNCSYVDERYKPSNKPVRIEVDENKNFTVIEEFY